LPWGALRWPPLWDWGTLHSNQNVIIFFESVTRMLWLHVHGGMHENCMLYKVSCMDGTHGRISAKDYPVVRNTKPRTIRLKEHKAKLAVFHGCQTYSCVTKYIQHGCPRRNIHFSVGPSLSAYTSKLLDNIHTYNILNQHTLPTAYLLASIAPPVKGECVPGSILFALNWRGQVYFLHEVAVTEHLPSVLTYATLVLQDSR
jgi:hypothetical protein